MQSGYNIGTTDDITYYMVIPSMISLHLTIIRIGIFNLLWVNICHPKPCCKIHDNKSYLQCSSLSKYLSNHLRCILLMLKYLNIMPRCIHHPLSILLMAILPSASWQYPPYSHMPSPPS